MTNQCLTSVDSSLWDQAVTLPSLRRALSELSPMNQTAIYLRFWESKTIEEIAIILNLSWDETNLMLDETIKTLREVLPASLATKNNGAA